MTTIISKLQYINFETGEFVEEKPRTYLETIQLAEAFPWSAQRDHLLVNLTNPSITLQGENNDFLKLAVYFNNKFVLHYFSPEEALFTKSFTSLPAAYPYIQNYFQPTSFDTTDFRKENTWLQHNRKHFISQDFRYEITPATVKDFIVRTSAINFFTFLFFMIVLIVQRLDSFLWTPFIILFPFFFLFLGGLNLVLIIDYYRYAKNKILIMSKGNDIFYYGDTDSPTQYNKKDILRFIIKKPRNGRNPVYAFAVITIEFINGNTIQIPDIFVDFTRLENKLTGCTKIEKSGFPYLKT